MENKFPVCFEYKPIDKYNGVVLFFLIEFYIS